MINREEPVRFAARVLAALAILAGAFPTVGSAFGYLEWNADQVAAYILAANAVIGALGLVLGVQVRKLVTSTANPRDDAGNVLTPGPIGSTDPDELPPI